MTKELALKLKEAGFPLKRGKGCLCEKDNNCVHDYSPTLSELIEACEDGFGGLAKRLDGDGFYAWGSDFTYDYEEPAPKGEGDTPEESVANLWLVLNKK